MPAKSTTKRINNKKQQKKNVQEIEEKPAEIIEELKEVKPEVVVDNGFTESIKKEHQEEQQEKPDEKPEGQKGGEKPKRQTPPIFLKRNELSSYIVKETDFKGFRAPINKLISWIIENDEKINKIADKSSTVEDKLKQLEEVKKYFDKNKDKCIKLIKDFTPEKKEKQEYEKGKHFIIYKNNDSYSFVCVNEKGINGNITRHKKEGYEKVFIKYVGETYDIKSKKEEIKKYAEFTGRNSFKLMESAEIDDIYKLI